MIDMDSYEKMFQNITLAVLGKKLTGIYEYENWRTEYVEGMAKVKSTISNEEVIYPAFDFYKAMRTKMLTMDEAYNSIGKKQLTEKQVVELGISNAKDALKEICTTTPDTSMGVSSDLKDCSLYYSSHNCLKSSLMNESKCCAYCFWPRHSEYSLGCYYLFSSKFCIKCYNCENLNRCFELSDCNNCSDSLFCHNCENLNNCMFCFNTKAKKYAIFNVEIGKERYLEIKQKILLEITNRMETNKRLDFSIFSLSS
ncbi:hypothetical protein HZC07_01450 [Candidatus Micrarchaeota archaeon]|nr:hypothetical protein [Candidatus Micrarchaeota archaeon]